MSRSHRQKNSYTRKRNSYFTGKKRESTIELLCIVLDDKHEEREHNIAYGESRA